MESDNEEEYDHLIFNNDNEDDDNVNPNHNPNQNPTRRSEPNYTILTNTEITRLQTDKILDVSTVLSLTKSESTLLLCNYNWSTSRLHDDWFVDERKVRSKVGLLVDTEPNNLNLAHVDKKSKKDNNRKRFYECGICFEDRMEVIRVYSLHCGHFYCRSCWRRYIDVAVDDLGSGCLRLRCPEPKCQAALDPDTVKLLSSKKALTKYESYLTRSYVELNQKTTKWCPAPGCNNAVQFESIGGDNIVYDVVCGCGFEFCFNCCEEPHRPSDCSIVKEWILKNSSESENMKWIIAFSKPCPKCKRPIEKNTGCNHMTCGQPCLHHFCWLCLRSLDTKSNYSCNCNGFDRSRTRPGQMNDEETQRNLAKQSLQRYAHYYERWAGNNKSRDKALTDLAEMKSVKIEQLGECLGIQALSTLDFVIKAWEKIVECRRILKWSYTYGFFKLEHEDTKRQLFEYLQGEAERALERLHFCAETELNVFFDPHSDSGSGSGPGPGSGSGSGSSSKAKSGPGSKSGSGPGSRSGSGAKPKGKAKAGAGAEDEVNWGEFRHKLLRLTKVTGTFFENLLRGLENGLSEVRGKEPEPEPEPEPIEEDVELEEAHWNCDRCNYLNPPWLLTCDSCFEEA